MRQSQLKTSRSCKVVRLKKKMSSVEIATLRKDTLGVSQSLFAGLLNVSLQTVQAWEQGVRRPSPMALNLLQTMSQFPEVFDELVEAKENGRNR